MDYRDMVYSACCEWFHDWIAEHPPSLVDDYDLATWMNEEMTHATETFISHAFHTPRGRGDALVILRALYYEYAQLRVEAARTALVADESAAPRLRVALQTPQKTAAWHAESRDILSGHEFGSLIVGSTGEYIQAMAKKCTPPSPFVTDADVEEQIVFLTPPDGLSPFKWGWRYEPVARALFERCFAGGAVDDSLGRVRHSSLPGLGASPDGVIVDGPCAGRLVELKCPVSRVLDDNIPPRYWVQMQLQAEVCDVEAVEYFEVVIATGSVPATTALPWIGKVCVIAPYVDAPWTSYKYEYSPLFPATLEGAESLEEWMPPTDGVVLESQTWWVRDYRRRTVLRNRRWWANVGAPAYTAFWRDVIAARADGRFASRPMFVSDSSTVASKRDDAASDDQESVSPWSVCDDQT